MNKKTIQGLQKTILGMKNYYNFIQKKGPRKDQPSQKKQSKSETESNHNVWNYKDKLVNMKKKLQDKVKETIKSVHLTEAQNEEIKNKLKSNIHWAQESMNKTKQNAQQKISSIQTELKKYQDKEKISELLQTKKIHSVMNSVKDNVKDKAQQSQKQQLQSETESKQNVFNYKDKFVNMKKKIQDNVKETIKSTVHLTEAQNEEIKNKLKSNIHWAQESMNKTKQNAQQKISSIQTELKKYQDKEKISELLQTKKIHSVMNSVKDNVKDKVQQIKESQAIGSIKKQIISAANQKQQELINKLKQTEQAKKQKQKSFLNLFFSQSQSNKQKSKKQQTDKINQQHILWNLMNLLLKASNLKVGQMKMFFSKLSIKISFIFIFGLFVYGIGSSIPRQIRIYFHEASQRKNKIANSKMIDQIAMVAE